MRKFHAILLALAFLVAGLLIGARTALDNAILISDLDADGHKILNLPSDQPLPPPVLGASIPPAWLGTTSTTAAQGDLAEFKANKAQANGYASLDSGGKVPSAQMPTGIGLGTVTSVGVTTANGISATGGPITGSGSFTFSLGAIVPQNSTISGTAGAGWLGFTAQSTDPTGFTSLKMWADTAGKLSFASPGFGSHVVKLDGTLTANQAYHLPDKSGTVQLDSDIPTTMVGVGGSHKGGLVPDTGASGDATNYLARDGTWKTVGTFTAPSYQPVLPTPQIFPTTNTTGARNISLGLNGATDTNVFYEIDSNTGPFLQTAGVPISLPGGSIIYVYQSKAGYTNSSMASYTNPNP